MKKDPPKEKISFEKAFERLEEIVQKLEEGTSELDKSLELFEEGVRLSRFCSEKLEEAKKKVEILMKKDGKLTPKPFDPEGEASSEKEGKKEEELPF